MITETGIKIGLNRGLNLDKLDFMGLFSLFENLLLATKT